MQPGPYIVTTPRNVRFVVDPKELIDGCIASVGAFELRFLETMERLLPDHAIMIDIGANVGNHALYLYRQCEIIHCFEPNPRAYTRLEENIALNAASNIIVHKFGLGARDAVAQFRDNQTGNLGASGFLEGGYHTGAACEIIELPIRQAFSAIDALGLERIDFIKIDVEGLEVDLFESLGPMINHLRPIVGFEHHESLSAPKAFERICASLENYVIVEVQFSAPHGNLPARAIDFLRHGGRSRLIEVTHPDHRSYENLLAIPGESTISIERHPELA